MSPDDLDIHKESAYRVRFLFSVVIAELLILAVIHFYPRRPLVEDTYFSHSQVESPDFREIEITHQTSTPAAPAKPGIPAEKPEDRIMDEPVSLEQFQRSAMPADTGSLTGGSAGNAAGQPVADPDQGPHLFKIVEPQTPPAARKAGVKAIIEVRFLIDKTGKVREASIVRIKRFKENGTDYEIVPHIGYGLTKATIEAAFQWKFRPAREEGRPVASYSIHSFTYGF